MAKNVTVWLKGANKKEYQDVSVVEDFDDFNKLIAIRLYGEDDTLRAVIGYDEIQRLEVEDKS